MAMSYDDLSRRVGTWGMPSTSFPDVRGQEELQQFINHARDVLEHRVRQQFEPEIQRAMQEEFYKWARDYLPGHMRRAPSRDDPLGQRPPTRRELDEMASLFLREEFDRQTPLRPHQRIVMKNGRYVWGDEADEILSTEVPPKPERKANMSKLTNYTWAIFLMHDKARLMKGIFETDEEHNRVHGRPAKREFFKTLDPNIKVGDVVVVETGNRHLASTIKIVEADLAPDFNSSETVRWIITKVDFVLHEKIHKLEADSIERLKQLELKKQRNDLKKDMLADFNGEFENMDIGHKSR